MTGSFTISLDFELRWGVRDSPGAEGYTAALLGGRQAIPQMLQLFETYGVAATWATVGFLFAETRDEMVAHMPACRPDYAHGAFSPYDDVARRVGQREADDPLHYGLSLVRQIEATPHQEIGSHTFSHFYCLESGGDAQAFAADLTAAQAIATAKGVQLKSLVLPRNQVSGAHLAEAKRAGFTSFRGTPTAPFYQPKPRGEETRKHRAMRLLDSALPLTDTLATVTDRPEAQLVNTPASRFLRPVRSATAPLAKAQRRRIMGEMTKAAQSGKTYHLWWHPHNFGRAREANLAHLRIILEHFRHLRDTHGFRPMTMGDLAQEHRERAV